jgi:hypothetical protein
MVSLVRQLFALRRPADGGGPAADPRPPLHVMHIGKTGGTALNHVLVEHHQVARYRLVFGGHEVTLADVPRGERFMFFIRDPLTRFVSAFNGRLREDRPRYHYPWNDDERRAFSLFKTPDQLGAALSSEDPDVRAEAEAAMRGIGHLNTGYSYWFSHADALRARIDDIFFIGFQDRLDEDFELLKRKLPLPPEAKLPRGDAAHQAPAEYDSHLRDLARSNLERWYAADLEFVAACRELASVVNSAGDLGYGVSVTRAGLRSKAHPKGEFHEWDVMAVELEVAELLYALIRAAKPRLVVEAGTGRGIAACFIAEALRDNGAGRLITYEPDPLYVAEARAALEGLPADVREGRSFEHQGEPPQVVFIDSLGGCRHEDVEFWLAGEPLPLVIVHDANRDYGLQAGARLTAGRGVWMLGSA